MTIEYITTRDLQNSSGEFTGKVRIIKLKDQDLAMLDYTCPECSFVEKKQVEWKRPFSFRCSKCNFLIRILKLKAEIKKMKKRV